VWHQRWSTVESWEDYETEVWFQYIKSGSLFVRRQLWFLIHCRGRLYTNIQKSPHKCEKTSNTYQQQISGTGDKMRLICLNGHFKDLLSSGPELVYWRHSSILPEICHVKIWWWHASAETCNLNKLTCIHSSFVLSRKLNISLLK
jgi:hypothetical protein